MLNATFNNISVLSWRSVFDIVYGDEDKCDLINKYFSLIWKFEEENLPPPSFDIKTKCDIKISCFIPL
jgi:hypothetical protein